MPAAPARALIPLAVAVLTVAMSLLRVAWTPGFYYADDTQLGSVGIWYALGDSLLRGVIPTLDPQAWQAGNYWAEGQWGLINPIIWAIAIGTRLSADVAVTATIVKIVFLVVLALGTYVLARSFSASPTWAGVAAVLVPQAGVTAYIDGPAWVSDLITTALFPWVWWALRRAVAGRSPIPFLILGYLLVTVGYVFGTIMLAVLLAEALVTAIVRRDRRTVLRAVAASSWSALWTIVIYLPGVLTAPVTKRGTTEIGNYFFLNADLSDLGSATIPVATSSVGAWWGPVTAGPLMYIAWALPLVLLTAPWARSQWRGTRPLVVVAVVTLLFVLGPSDIGPLRWPIRLMPYLAIAALVLFALLMTRGYPQRVSRRGLMSAVVVAVVMAWLSWAQTPSIWRSVVLCLLVQLIVVVGGYLLARLPARSAPSGPRVREGSVAAIIAAGIAIITVGFAAYQMRAFPVSPLPTFAAPSEVRQMAEVLDDSEGDVTTVGDALSNAFSPATFEESLIANLWYFSTANVANVYTVLPFSTYSDDLCVDLRGSTCAGALDTLLSVDDATGAVVADLLSVSGILAYRTTVPDAPAALPDGWRVVSEGEATWRIARDHPLPSAGGVTWVGPGTVVTEVRRDETSVSVRVDAVGADPRVILSRLAWPGYQIQGAAFADPTRGYLLTVDVSAASPGDVVTVSFAPPGRVLLIASGVAAVVLGIAWTVIFVVDRARRRRETPAPEG